MGRNTESLEPLDLPRRDTAEASAYRARARDLGLSFLSHVRLGSRAAPSPDDDIETGRAARTVAGDLIIAPAEGTMPAVARWLRRYGAWRGRVAIATPTAIRAGLRDARSRDLLGEAVTRVERVDPIYSARKTFTPSQVAILTLLVAAIGFVFVLQPGITAALMWTALAAFFLAVSFIRWTAALEVRACARPWAPAVPDDAPIYTVLVPLRHEANMIGQILAGLDRLAWPRDRLDVKLVIDADDTQTLSVARAHATEPPYEVVEVPAGGPRTKPMALQYALGFARGAFVTVYDAEDRPHPRQLAEAYATFRSAPENLACLQAPLLIDNHHAGVLAALFAIEYAALFDGLLPSLARHGLPLPLGGTSNHFRREALERVGGWDPHNVTEDADLGIRLTRFGYTIDTITLPTLEEAPVDLRTWIRQRTRWMKGWMQTWLVHMRRPVALWRTVGTRQFLGFNVLGLGMIVSAIAHPIFLLTPLYLLFDPHAPWRDGGTFTGVFAAFTLINLICGYAAMWRLSQRTLTIRGRQALLPFALLLPFYWLLISLATLRAFGELLVRPHGWNKTPHTATPSATKRTATEPPRAPRHAARRAQAR